MALFLSNLMNGQDNYISCLFQKTSTAGELTGIYFSPEAGELKDKSEREISGYFENRKSDLVNYVWQQYDVNLTDHYEPDDPTLYFTGLLIAANDIYNNESIKTIYGRTAADFINCFMSGMGIVELGQAVQSAITGQLTTSQVLNVVRKIGRRYLGWFGVITAVYVAGDCLGIW